jgi:hypothetical protein
MPRPAMAHGQPSEVEGELQLVYAILAQALKDLRSPWVATRLEAHAFWTDPAAVTPWADIVGMDPDALMTAVAQRQPRTSP